MFGFFLAYVGVLPQQTYYRSISKTLPCVRLKQRIPKNIKGLRETLRSGGEIPTTFAETQPCLSSALGLCFINPSIECPEQGGPAIKMREGSAWNIVFHSEEMP